MSKEESKMMQGVAILLMIYLHLFNCIGNADLCYNFLYIGDVPFSNILTRACSPVAFFLILSGYGLYMVEKKNSKYNLVSKIRKLYVHYWISLLIFVTIGAFVVGINKYPGTWVTIISNISAWNTNSWNCEVWFLFPYLLLALSSRWIFRLMDKVNIWIFMGGSLILSTAAAYCVSRYGEEYLYTHQLSYMPILYFDCLFAFVAGAWMAKFHVVEKLRDKFIDTSINKCKPEGGGNCEIHESRNKRKKEYSYGWIYWILLVILIAFRCCFETGAFHTFYAIAFIILFVNAPRWKWVDKFLMEMGRRSTSIWFVHTYFCYYLFHDFIYSFRYPVVIFLVLLGCSYASAVVIDFINKKVQMFIK